MPSGFVLCIKQSLRTDSSVLVVTTTRPWDLKYSKATIIEYSHTIDILRQSSDALLLLDLEKMKPP